MAFKGLTHVLLRAQTRHSKGPTTQVRCSNNVHNCCYLALLFCIGVFRNERQTDTKMTVENKSEMRTGRAGDKLSYDRGV